MEISKLNSSIIPNVRQFQPSREPSHPLALQGVAQEKDMPHKLPQVSRYPKNQSKQLNVPHSAICENLAHCESKLY